jgi:hypothetical protein
MDIDAEIAAYVGALAWFPQIATWIYRAVVKPNIIIVPEPYAEVGFTSYGPIFNLRLAFTTDHKPAVIESIELDIKHERGDTRTFRWAGLSETFSEIRDERGNPQQTVTRDQTPVALRLGTESLVEKFVRFQEPHYHEADRPPFSKLVAFFNHLRRTDETNCVEKALVSQELHDVVERRRNSFWWKEGRYEVVIRLRSPRAFRLERSKFSFSLTQPDIAKLMQNVEAVRLDLEQAIKSNLPDYQFVQLKWNWASVRVEQRHAS